MCIIEKFFQFIEIFQFLIMEQIFEDFFLNENYISYDKL